jgi:hypothetical protein
LTKVVEAVRSQLTNAVQEGEGRPLQFELGDIELEFTVTMTTEAKVAGGIKVWVVNAGGSAAEAIGTAHKLKLTLKPKDMRTGQPPHVADSLDVLPPR